jgi:catechol 2,3-dioxygenase-like lactoylglutathione lyase family enzyme
MQFDHIGIVTAERKAGEIFVPATRVWRTEAAEHPFRVEWLRFEPDSPVTGPVREMPHVAYSVDDVQAAGEGMEVLLEPFDVGPRIVAFYRTPDGAVVEFVQHKET